MRNNITYNFCIVTYETLPNPITQNLKTYLLENYNCNLMYIYHPMLDIKEGYQISSGFDLFKGNKLLLNKKAYHWKLYWPFSYLKDVIYTFCWGVKFAKKIDVYFAAGNLNPLMGIVLRQLGFVKKVVYYSQDYYPVRFKNSFFNWIYFLMDKFCVKFSDETWNVNPRIARIRHDKLGNGIRKQYTVPGCIWFHKVKRLPFNKINRNKIIYRGTLQEFMGIDLVIRAMPLILKKFPNLVFEIIGVGKDRERLVNLCKRLNVSKHVIFHGFVPGREQLERVLSDAAIGIATFNTSILDDKVKNSDPGKIKDYMLMGMPVITTKEVYYHQKITDQKCGLVVKYNKNELAVAVIKLLQDRHLLKKYRNNAIKFIEKFDCNYILKFNLERIIH